MSREKMVEHFEQPGFGKVERVIAPNQPGRVFFEGTYWSARWHRPTEISIAEVESWVTVLGRQGLTLLVQPNASTIPMPSPSQASVVASTLPQQSQPTVETVS